MKTVLRALEETENSFSNYHAQQKRLVKLNAQAQEANGQRTSRGYVTAKA